MTRAPITGNSSWRRNRRGRCLAIYLPGRIGLMFGKSSGSSVSISVLPFLAFGSSRYRVLNVDGGRRLTPELLACYITNGGWGWRQRDGATGRIGQKLASLLLSPRRPVLFAGRQYSFLPPVLIS